MRDDNLVEGKSKQELTFYERIDSCLFDALMWLFLGCSLNPFTGSSWTFKQQQQQQHHWTLWLQVFVRTHLFVSCLVIERPECDNSLPGSDGFCSFDSMTWLLWCCHCVAVAVAAFFLNERGSEWLIMLKRWLAGVLVWQSSLWSYLFLLLKSHYAVQFLWWLQALLTLIYGIIQLLWCNCGSLLSPLHPFLFQIWLFWPHCNCCFCFIRLSFLHLLLIFVRKQVMMTNTKLCYSCLNVINKG